MVLAVGLTHREAKVEHNTRIGRYKISLGLTAHFESYGAGSRLRLGWARRWSIRRIAARVTIASEGTVKLAACRGGRGCVAGWDDNACLPQLRRPPISGRDHQPRGLAVLPLPAQPAH